MLRRALLLALVGSILSAASAGAAEVHLHVESGATEDAPFQIEASGILRPQAQSAQLIVTVQREGEPCSMGARRVIDRRVHADGPSNFDDDFEVQGDHVEPDPAEYVACGWLLHDDGRVLAHSRLAFTLHSPVVGVTVTPSPSPDPERTIVERGIRSRAVVVVDTPVEAGRAAYATIKPAGAGAGCAPTFAADSGRTLLSGAPVPPPDSNGDLQLIPGDTFLFDDPGEHLLCAWVQESMLDPSPEGSDALTFTVPRSPTRTTLRGVDAVYPKHREFWVSSVSAATGVPVEAGSLTIERSPLATRGSFRFRRFGRAVSIARSRNQTVCLRDGARIAVVPNAIRVRVRSGYGWRYRVRYKGKRSLRASSGSLNTITAKRAKGIRLLDERTGRCGPKRPR